MKRKIIFAMLLATIAAGCHQNNDAITFYKDGDTTYYRCQVRTPMGEETIDVEKGYSIAWPENVPETLKHRLLELAFGDSTGDIHKATDRYTEDLMLWDEDTLIKAVAVDNKMDNTDSEGESYSHVALDYTKDSSLYCFAISKEYYIHHCAHGMYESHYVNYDADRRSIIHLNDLVDTALLAPIILRAVEDLTTNQSVNECLMEEFRQSVPVTDNFYIDSNRSTINLVYQPYEIASYACGMQIVTLPIFWLSKHIELTPYCKKLFGPESYIDEP